MLALAPALASAEPRLSEPRGVEAHGQPGLVDQRQIGPSREPNDAGETAAEERFDRERHEISDSEVDQAEATDRDDVGGPADAGPLEVIADREGRESRAGELVVIASRSDLGLIASLGLPIIEKHRLAATGGYVIRVGALDPSDPAATRARLATAAPQAVIDLNHVYRTAGTTQLAAGPRLRPHGKGVVGVVDTAVDSGSFGLASAVLEMRSFAPGPLAPPSHGTTVAYLAARQGARLLAAGVFTRDSAGQEVASVDAIARAVDWLVARGARVINLSLEGPPNQALAEIIRRAQVRGCVVVAAAGNRGPAAPPAYPAAYPSVVAVTAVDASGRAYTYANRGSYIMFAARGVDVQVPGQGPAPTNVSGTSFAAPVVAAVIAGRLEQSDHASVMAVVDTLKREAKHLGTPGRNDIFGYGLIGEY